MSIKEKLLAQVRKADSSPKTPDASAPDAETVEPTRCAKSAPFPTKLVRTKAGDIVFAKLNRSRAPLEPYEPTRNRRNGKWVKGSSGNGVPGDMSISRYAYELTGGGQEMIDHAAMCLRGAVWVRWEDDDGVLCERRAPAQLKDQTDAREFLEDAIRPEVQRAMADAGEQEQWDFTRLSDDQFIQFQQLLALVRPSARVTGSPGQDVIEADTTP